MKYSPDQQAGDRR